MADIPAVPPPEPQSLESGATDWLVSVDEQVEWCPPQKRPVVMCRLYWWQLSGARSSEGGSQRSMAARIDSSKGVTVEGGGCLDGTGKSSKTICNWVTSAVVGQTEWAKLRAM